MKVLPIGMLFGRCSTRFACIAKQIAFVYYARRIFPIFSQTIFHALLSGNCVGAFQTIFLYISNFVLVANFKIIQAKS